jgi:hypothetical protein
MNEMLELCQGTLTFNTRVITEHKESPDVFYKGFKLLLLVGLIVGLVAWTVDTIRLLSTVPPGPQAQARANAEIQPFLQLLPSSMGKQVHDFYLAGSISQNAYQNASMPLPRPLAVVFGGITMIVRLPFAWLGLLISYGACVHVFAKLLGGRARISQMLGSTSLACVPHIFDIFILPFLPLPVVGTCIYLLGGVIVLFWSLAVYVKTTSVSQEMSIGRTVFAALLPFMIIALIYLPFVGLLVNAISRVK